jgi:hypothetical protein
MPCRLHGEERWAVALERSLVGRSITRTQYLGGSRTPGLPVDLAPRKNLKHRLQAQPSTAWLHRPPRPRHRPFFPRKPSSILSEAGRHPLESRCHPRGSRVSSPRKPSVIPSEAGCHPPRKPGVIRGSRVLSPRKPMTTKVSHMRHFCGRGDFYGSTQKAGGSLYPSRPGPAREARAPSFTSLAPGGPRFRNFHAISRSSGPSSFYSIRVRGVPRSGPAPRLPGPRGKLPRPVRSRKLPRPARSRKLPRPVRSRKLPRRRPRCEPVRATNVSHMRHICGPSR